MAWLYKRDGSAVWWIGWRVGKRQFLKSTGEREEARAKKVLATYEVMKAAKDTGSLTQTFYESLTGKTLPKEALKAAMASWIKECEGSTKAGTVTRYKGIMEAFCDFLKADDNRPMLDDVTTAEVRGYLDQQRAASGASTTNHHRRILSIFFRRAVKNGLMRANPVDPIPGLKRSEAEKRTKRAFTLAELKLIYAKAPNDFWRYMIAGGFFSGQRMGDLIMLKADAVNFAKGEVKITQIKTGRAVAVPLRAELRGLLVNALAGRTTKPGDYVWPEQAAMYAEWGASRFSLEFFELILFPCGLAEARTKEAKATPGRKITPITFHSLRHSAVTLLRATGSSQAVAKEIAGHASSSVSDHYTNLPPETLKAAIDLLPEISS